MAMQSASAQINVTPLIDVLLVLLIIFMVIQPQHSEGLKAHVPQPAPDTPQAQQAPPSDVVVSIHDDRSIALNSQPVELADLEGRLRRIFISRPSGVLFVQGAPALNFEDVARVLDSARGAGVPRIALITTAGG